MKRRTFFKLIVFLILVFSALSLGRYSPVVATSNRKDNGIGLTHLQEGETFFFEDGRSPAIFIKEDGNLRLIETNTPSLPIVSPNQAKMAYIAPFFWQESGELYVFNIKDDNPRKILAFSDLPATSTPKTIHWLDNQYLMVIVGDAYNPASIGGDVYLVDSESGRHTIMYEAENDQEVRNLKVGEDNVIIELALFNIDQTEYDIYSTAMETLTIREIAEMMPNK